MSRENEDPILVEGELLAELRPHLGEPADLEALLRSRRPRHPKRGRND